MFSVSEEREAASGRADSVLPHLSNEAVLVNSEGMGGGTGILLPVIEKCVRKSYASHNFSYQLLSHLISLGSFMLTWGFVSALQCYEVVTERPGFHPASSAQLSFFRTLLPTTMVSCRSVGYHLCFRMFFYLRKNTCIIDAQILL